MKYFFAFFLILVLLKPSVAQRFLDYGIIAGGSSYMGDINTARPFYKPSLSFGGLMRYNINRRYSIRASGYYFGLKGDLSDFPDHSLLNVLPNRSFSRNFFDLTGQVEFNFLPYMTGLDEGMWSPYLAGGLGYATNVGLVIPFGAGFKINLTTRLSAGAEWSCRRTFTDNIDGVESFLGNTLLNNNDWYSVYGLFITYKFFKFAADCPAYK